jgi:serine/threonine protein kinase
MATVNATKNLDIHGYTVVKCLGTGARSTIWQLRQHKTGAMFALKRVVRQDSSDERFFNQAYNEYKIASALDHPAIRKLYWLKKCRRPLRVKEVRILMEFCSGQTLQENRPTSIVNALGLFHTIAEAITHINARGFVHADLKPNNIIAAPDGTVKIIDLGQSCPIGTIKERIQGTPDYIAPEQVRREPLDARTDVFNFGATLYWVLTGKPIQTILPKDGVVQLVSDKRTPPPEELNPNIPGPLSKLIVDCIQLLPTQRPKNMNIVTSRLDLCLTAAQRNGKASP